MSTENTDQLILQIKAGDSQAFEQLVNEHKSFVFSLALQFLKNREVAEEVAQDVFVKVFTSLQGFKGESKFSTWLYRITRNCCLDLIRKNKMKFKETTIEEVSFLRLDDATNALELMMEKERNEKLRNCLEYLSPDDASILTLFYFEEKNLNEVAEILQISINLAKVRVHRARKRLATVLLHNIEPEILKSYG